MPSAEQAEAVARHFLFIVVLPPEGAGEFSLFQGFSLNTFPVLGALQHICTLPPKLDELFIEREDAMRLRAAGVGGYEIFMLDLEYVTGIREGFDGFPYTIFVSTAETRDEVENHVRQHGRQGWLHLTTGVPTQDIRSLATFTRNEMFAWTRDIAVERVRERGEDPAAMQWRPFVQWPEWNLRLRSRAHRTTEPTESVLRSFGATLGEATAPLVGNEDHEYAHAISRAAMTLEAFRSRALKGLRRIPGVPAAIVTVPSVYRRLSIGHLKRGASRGARLAVRNVLRQQQYTALRAPVDDHQAIHDDDFAKAALLGRAQELAMYTTALSISAASLGCPVLRCPPQVDRIRELLLRLSGVRGHSQASAERRNRLALRIGDALHAAIPRQIVNHIQRHHHQGIKFVGDTPLELLRIDDLPVGLAGTTSRLPTLPGNLLMRQALIRAPHLLTAEDFRQVLIVRTLEPNDPLRGMLDIALRGFEAELAGRIDIRIVDVSTRDEFVAAFNGFDGTLAIFDGHGRHQRGARNGTLAVGPLEIDVFELYHHIKVPSIVWLSACETHPLDGVENSVASAFLFMGARSVLGSNMPISGPNGALLVARFLYRLADFLPMLNATIPWAEVVSGMLRMSYVTDILRAMKEPLHLTDDAYRTVHTRANTAINMFRPDWFPSLLDDIARATGTDVPTIRDLWLRTCYFTDTLRYVHLGVPEHMFVVPNDN